jgi:hypothetical protein
VISVIKTKKCNKCGGEWDAEAFFRKRNLPHMKLSAPSFIDYHPTCIGCELSERNDPTPEERARRKADNSIRLHAEKYKMKPSEFATRFGWDIERMVYEILHGHENTCPYCYERYDVMGHGLTDITLDIVNPEREPYYRTNVKWCCATCNREKATMPPELWDRRLIVWPQYMAWRERIRGDVTHGLPLFNERQLFE